ncbi:formate/nitrite transporter family protein [Falsirhodobacter sp. 20TX0035]|uniref:formate/nitrite transporter family protein n=1 Tax=Falsirhodobacter sp. 20TX0035 TaxID=3022019 RepID=UPI00232AB251|nr:formate/nitrite transporter family protein [Falsirhodobacter sp. 20TX0035]MDB6453096.1 formate/nitrite transporter family protein [Falsirhodobacter sp. 20TX0035]
MSQSSDTSEKEVVHDVSRTEVEELEEDLPSAAAAVHQLIREDGEKEMERDIRALLWSAIAGGITLSTSMLARAVLEAHLPDTGAAFLLEAAGYTIGFILVIAAGQQLFTENTVTPMLPLMTSPTRRNLFKVSRLWTVVLFGNILGGLLSAAVFAFLPLFSPEVDTSLAKIGHHLMENSAWEMFSKGIMSGWLIATLVWTLYSFEKWTLPMIFLVTYLIGIGDFPHIIVGAIEVAYLVFLGQLGVVPAIFQFGIPTLLGNIVGGTFIFALISHAQVRSEVKT